MRLIGIDPSLTATGFALIDADGSSCHLLARRTLVAGLPTMQLADRLDVLAAGAALVLADFLEMSTDPYKRIVGLSRDVEAIVLEDPTDQVHIGKDRQRSPTSIAKLGAAVGALMLVARRATEGTPAIFQAIPAGMWIPKERGHPVKHELHARQLRALVTFGRDAQDDELMAAGVAWYYARDRARPLQLQANYAPVPRRKRVRPPLRGAS